jgi:hypothetical protein
LAAALVRQALQVQPVPQQQVRRAQAQLVLAQQVQPVPERLLPVPKLLAQVSVPQLVPEPPQWLEPQVSRLVLQLCVCAWFPPQRFLTVHAKSSGVPCSGPRRASRVCVRQDVRYHYRCRSYHSLRISFPLVRLRLIQIIHIVLRKP